MARAYSTLVVLVFWILSKGPKYSKFTFTTFRILTSVYPTELLFVWQGGEETQSHRSSMDNYQNLQQCFNLIQLIHNAVAIIWKILNQPNYKSIN